MAKSLASKNETPNLPALPSDVGVDTSRVGGVPYVNFISAKSQRFAEFALALPGLKEPDAVLVLPTPELPVRLAPFKAHIVQARQYWVTMEDDGEITYVQRARPSEYNPALKEQIEAMLVVYHGERLVPARITFKTTKCVGAAVAAKTLKMASTPSWGNLSLLHAATMQIEQPWARFTATFRCSQKTARSTGRKYFQSDAAINPTSPAEATLLDAALQSPDFQLVAMAVAYQYTSRITRLEEIAG